MAGKANFYDMGLMIKLYTEDKLSCREIAKEMGLNSHQLVSRQLKLFGVVIKPQKSPAKDILDSNKDLVLDLYINQDLNTRQISKRFGITKGAVLEFLHKHKVSLRPAHAISKPFTIWMGYAIEHGKLRSRRVVEEFHGITLKDHNIVHHIDEDKLNDAPYNLLPCEDDSYHKGIHMRLRHIARRA